MPSQPRWGHLHNGTHPEKENRLKKARETLEERFGASESKREMRMAADIKSFVAQQPPENVAHN